MSPWVEAEEAGAATFTFDGVDKEAKDALERENFQRAVKYGDGHGQNSPPRSQARRNLALAAVMALGFYASIVPLSGSYGPSWGDALFVITSLGSIAILALIGVVSWRRARPIVRPSGARFTLRVEPERISCTGGRTPVEPIPLEEIVAFQGDDRLRVALADGRTVTLPCVLPAGGHAALADALERKVAELRAGQGGFRGPAVRVAPPGERDAEAPIADEEEPQRSAPPGGGAAYR